MHPDTGPGETGESVPEPNDKGTARQELINCIREMTLDRTIHPGSTEPRNRIRESANSCEKEYCHFMLRAPGNETVISIGQGLEA